MDGDNACPDRPDTVSRRTLLRKSAVASAVGMVGGSGFMGTVVATSVCPQPPEYWTTHWHERFGERMIIPPAGELRKEEIRDRLRTSGDDTVDIMAKQYLGTYLNLWLRPWIDPGCANKSVKVDGIGMVEWEHVKNAAQDWLRRHDWRGTEHTSQRTWEPAVEVEGTTAKVNGEVLKNALEAFNTNQFDQLNCNCDTPDSGNGTGDEDVPSPTTVDDCTTITDSGRYAITDNINANDEDVCIEIEADDVVLDGRGHTIDGGGTSRRGVLAGELLSIDVTTVTVKNLRVTGFETAGIALQDATGGTIRNVTVTDSHYGIEYQNARDTTITKSVLSRNELGVFVTDGSGDNVFARNDITSNTGHGVFITEFSEGHALHWNRITDNGGSGVAFNDGSSDPELVGNVLQENDGDGISLGDLTGAEVQRNRTIENGADGIRLSDVNQSRLVENVSRRNADDGIELVDSDDNTLIGNIVHDNNDGAIVIAGTSSGNTLKDNDTD